TPSISQSFDGTNLILSGDDTTANYQLALRTIKYNNTLGGPGVASETVPVKAVDANGASSNIATATIAINLPPVIDLGNAPNYSMTWNYAPVNIENVATATVTDDSG